MHDLVATELSKFGGPQTSDKDASARFMTRNLRAMQKKHELEANGCAQTRHSLAPLARVQLTIVHSLSHCSLYLGNLR